MKTVQQPHQTAPHAHTHQDLYGAKRQDGIFYINYQTYIKSFDYGVLPRNRDENLKQRLTHMFAESERVRAEQSACRSSRRRMAYFAAQI